MRWYWVVLIIIGVASLVYLVWMNIPKKTTTKTTVPPLGNVGDTGGAVTPG